MNKNTFIFGITDLARVLYRALCAQDERPTAFVVDDAYVDNNVSFMGLPLLPYSRLPDMLPPDDYEAYVCIGYTNMNRVRQQKSEELKYNGYALKNFIHHKAIVDLDEIGVGNLIFQGTIIDAYSRIGNGNIFYPGALIAHDTKIGNYNFFAPCACVAGHVHIGDRCFFGINSTLKNDIRIGDGVFVGAGSYADRDLQNAQVMLPPRSIVLEDTTAEELIKKVCRS